MSNHSSIFISYDQSGQNVTRLLFQYQDRHIWFCPQPLPVLIQKPFQLTDQLQALDLHRPSEGHA